MDAKRSTQIKYDYDKSGDVLYAFIGESTPAISEETSNGVLIRRDIKTNEIVGFTIVNYSRKKKRGQLKAIPYFPNVKLP